jgi:hypothetical protein
MRSNHTLRQDDYYRAGPPPPLSAHRTLEDRVQGEAEARSDLAGQFHEALADLITFTQEAHEAVMLNEANITALQNIQARLIDAFDEYIVYSTNRMDALSTAVEAVWNVTKPRPSILSRILGR